MKIYFQFILMGCLVCCLLAGIVACDSKKGSQSSRPLDPSAQGIANTVTSVDEGFKLQQPLPPTIDQTFFCADGTKDGFVLHLENDGAAEATSNHGASITKGQYTLQQDRLHVRLPQVNFEGFSSNLETGLGLIIQFKIGATACHAIGHTRSESITGYFKCPTIRWVSNFGFEDNAFDFQPNGMVQRRRWKEITYGSGDTLYREIYGIYFRSGNRFYMAFGNSDEDRYLSATVEGNTFMIQEMEPDKGPCESR